MWTGAIGIRTCSLTITELTNDELRKGMVIGNAATGYILAIPPNLGMAPALTADAAMPADLRHDWTMIILACRVNVGGMPKPLVGLLEKMRDIKFGGANLRLGRATTSTRWPM